jgi:hypothetical protein
MNSGEAKMRRTWIPSIALIVGLTALSVPVLGREADPNKKIPDANAAIAAAEKAAVMVLGANVVQARPFTASQHGNVWLVISKPAPTAANPSGPKQSVVVELDETTGEVLDLSTAQ